MFLAITNMSEGVAAPAGRKLPVSVAGTPTLKAIAVNIVRRFMARSITHPIRIDGIAMLQRVKPGQRQPIALDACPV
ncbi:MAG TPA: hypothetical protein VNS22_14055 [Geminicoccus sp.]|nr:hypothetical protein [Geminicoccus sp.]